jgi:hypothetical protein
VPYFDINPHRPRPKWLGYVVLAVLTVLTAFVVIVALSGPQSVQGVPEDRCTAGQYPPPWGC